MAEAKAGKRVVLSVDAAHFVYGAFLSYLWSVARVFLRSPSGRQRFNVLGALDMVTRRVHIFSNETYITATSVCALLDQIATFYAPRKIPITIFLDNARYQHCGLVIAHATVLGIHLEFLPSYSPNLNLIERYWKWVKKRCLNSVYHPNFTSMKNAILETTSTAHEHYTQELISLLSWNFQTFSKLVIF